MSAPTPSWKTRTSRPYAAPTESRLTAIAVSGTTIERKARVRSRKLRARTKAITIGSQSRDEREVVAVLGWTSANQDPILRLAIGLWHILLTEPVDRLGGLFAASLRIE